MEHEGSHQLEAGHSNLLLRSDLEKKITDAFDVFDHGANKNVEVREVGTILRSLGCVPSEAEVQEIMVLVEDHETSSVPLASFVPVVAQIICERKLQPAPPEELLKAFCTLDKEGKGYITKEYLSKLITEEGEVFSEEELGEMMSIAVDPETGHINYEYYINQIMIHSTHSSASIYSLIPKVEPKKKVDLAAFLQD